jgi:hypothetical protein
VDLGLSITDGITYGHHRRIKVHRELNQGLTLSTFTQSKTANFFPDIVKKSSSKFNALLIFLLGYYSMIYRERLHLEKIVNSAVRKTSL